MSEESALAEGIEYYDPGDGNGYYEFKPLNVWGERHKECYAAIWNSVNGSDSWQADKWTWAIKFEPHSEAA